MGCRLLLRFTIPVTAMPVCTGWKGVELDGWMAVARVDIVTAHIICPSYICVVSLVPVICFGAVLCVVCDCEQCFLGDDI